jgi:hypothetical protein
MAKNQAAKNAAAKPGAPAPEAQPETPNQPVENTQPIDESKKSQPDPAADPTPRNTEKLDSLGNEKTDKAQSGVGGSQLGPRGKQDVPGDASTPEERADVKRAREKAAAKKITDAKDSIGNEQLSGNEGPKLGPRGPNHSTKDSFNETAPIAPSKK